MVVTVSHDTSLATAAALRFGEITHIRWSQQWVISAS
jgi:hypothetical protein